MTEVTWHSTLERVLLVFTLTKDHAEACWLQQTTEKRGREELPSPKVRGGNQEEQPHVQGVAAAWVQEGQEELLHIHSQKGWP